MAELFSGRQNLHRTAVDIRRLILVHKFKNSRRVGGAGISFPAGLQQMSIESLRMPRQEGLPTKMSRQTEVATYDFASDDG